MSLSDADNSKLVTCPLCSREVLGRAINEHIDSSCSLHAGLLSPKMNNSVVSSSKIKTRTIAPIFHKGTKREKTESQAQSHPNEPTHSTKRVKATHFEVTTPLAEKFRPHTFSDFVGQRHLVGPDSLLTTALANGRVGSIILWGPPGCGKTTLARLIARQTGYLFKEIGATGVGVNDVRIVLEEAKNMLGLTGKKTILFLDEIHRFNRAQQDIFLPFIEQGHIQFIGATTENPSFKINSALLSRCRVLVLKTLSNDDIKIILMNTLRRIGDSAGSLSKPAQVQDNPFPPSQDVPQLYTTSEDGDTLFMSFPQFTPNILTSLISLSAGDARIAISLLDIVITSPADSDETSLLTSIKNCVSVSYDRTGESHYDMISALHKSIRGSQGSAAMYWLARMLTAGEDPLYIARRLVVCASEDIGIADRHALPLAVSVLQACQMIGMPECRINLAHLVAYLSEAPKSTRAYEGYQRAEEAAKLDSMAPVPMQMRNAPTQLLKELGYGEGYHYNPEYVHPVHNNYLPVQFIGQKFLKGENDMSGKTWDEDALRQWEAEVNGGREWEGRSTIVCDT